MRSSLVLPIFAPLTAALWPIPTRFEHGDKVAWISKDVVFKWGGTGNLGFLNMHDANEYVLSANANDHDHPTYVDDDISRSVIPSGQEMVGQAVKTAKKNLFEKNFVPWKFRPRDWKEPERGVTITEVYINLLANAAKDIHKPPPRDADESYHLTVSETGKISITSNSTTGLVRGLETLSQLFYASEEHNDWAYSLSAPVEIFDTPKFQYRGLNLDVSRNWFSCDDIKRTIDGIAANKMNVLHLHVTDAQSWPLVIPSLPELSEKGAYRPHMIYSPEDFLNLHKYAALRGIEIITEIDMSGHTSIVALSHPELIAAYNMQPDWKTYAAEPPSGTLKLNSTAVYTFIDTLLDDVISRVRPYTSYFHTGGDEVDENAYLLDDTVKSNDPAIIQSLMQKFIDHSHGRVQKYHSTPIVWEEMLLQWNLTLAKDVIVQSWRSDQALAQIVAKGYRAIAGNHKYWYLDCGKGEFLNYDPSVSAAHWPYQDYCAPYHNWRQMYSYNPLASIPEADQHLVIGGEVHMWTEQTDPTNLDTMIWPRAAAAAEILWSGPKDAEGRNRSQIEAAPRLSEMRERLVARGIGADSIQMPYCTMDPIGCQLGFKP